MYILTKCNRSYFCATLWPVGGWVKWSRNKRAEKEEKEEERETDTDELHRVKHRGAEGQAETRNGSPVRLSVRLGASTFLILLLVPVHGGQQSHRAFKDWWTFKHLLSELGIGSAFICKLQSLVFKWSVCFLFHPTWRIYPPHVKKSLEFFYVPSLKL